MCGIAGIVDHGAGFGRDMLRDLAVSMRDAMVHRGPDDAGVWIDPTGTCALAHRRLSIIDLRPEGRQPMGNEDGAVQVTFNGEIYNFRELRDELVGKRHRFRSATDTEVLPHLFEDADPAHLQRLDGMFALALWHSAKRKLLLARDPFGKKPLYVAQGAGWFAFASELAALEQLPGLNTALDPEALAFYVLLQYVPAPWTIYRGVRKLQPGSCLEIDFSHARPTVREQSFASFRPRSQVLPRWPRSLDAQADCLKEILVAAISKRLISDVPLGAFLSGGVDSSLVVALMRRELGVPVKTFSIGFAGAEDSEHIYARQTAAHLGTEHYDQVLGGRDLVQIADIARMLDEPNGDSSCLPTYLLSRFARQHVTVALSGDGGDEMFGGYNRYKDTLLENASWKTHLARLVKQRKWHTTADGYLSPRWLIHSPAQVEALLGGLPRAVREQLREWRRGLNGWPMPAVHRMRRLDAATYLPGAVLAKVDRMSMRVGLEVRCPLLDRQVADFAEQLSPAACFQPPTHTKRILKHLAKRYLPEVWVQRKKMGFGPPPHLWPREEMTAMARDLLLGPSSRLAGSVEPAALREWVATQCRPDQFSIYQTWPLLILELWLRKSRARPARPRTVALRQAV